MADHTTLHRVDRLDSPTRCQSPTANGQCLMEAVPGGRNCIIHNGQGQIRKQEAASNNLLRLSKWQTRIDCLSEHPKVKSLKEEVAILRMILEEKLNSCQDSVDLLINGAAISSLINQIQITLLACQKLDEKLGLMIDKSQAQQLALEIIKIIIDEVSNPDQVDAIASKIIKLISPEQSRLPVEAEKPQLLQQLPSR